MLKCTKKSIQNLNFTLIVMDGLIYNINKHINGHINVLTYKISDQQADSQNKLIFEKILFRIIFFNNIKIYFKYQIKIV